MGVCLSEGEGEVGAVVLDVLAVSYVLGRLVAMLDHQLAITRVGVICEEIDSG